MGNISRNAPCPCGSGKKYKKCCLAQAQNASGHIGENVVPGLNEALAGQKFETLEEVQQFTNGLVQNKNRQPLAAFHNLSPEQMMCFLDFPFESPEVVAFNEPKSDVVDVPVIKLVTMLLEGIGESGVKATAKGNLPRNLCREIALHYWSKDEYQKRTQFGHINTEMDFFELHVVHLVAKLSGLLKKLKGKYLLTRKGLSYLSNGKTSELYFLLFKTYTTQFNWAYQDRYPELSIIQRSFTFTLYLLNRYGNQWKPYTEYAEYSMNAFPMVLEEIDEQPWATPEDEYFRCFARRSFEDFAIFFGLAEMDEANQQKFLKEEYLIRKLPLLNEIVHFNQRTVH